MASSWTDRDDRRWVTSSGVVGTIPWRHSTWNNKAGFRGGLKISPGPSSSITAPINTVTVSVTFPSILYNIAPHFHIRTSWSQDQPPAHNQNKSKHLKQHYHRIKN